jgi:hypothetical protein
VVRPPRLTDEPASRPGSGYLHSHPVAGLQGPDPRGPPTRCSGGRPAPARRRCRKWMSAIRAVHVRSRRSGRWCRGSRPVSRLLFPRASPGVAAIHLGPALPPASCGPPGDSAGPASAAASPRPVRPLFDLAPGGVYRADRSPGRWCALTAPFHPCRPAGAGRRSALCGTVLRVAPTGGWPAPCPVEAGLSSVPRWAGPRPPGRLSLRRQYATRFRRGGGILGAWFLSWCSRSSSSRWPSWP